MGSAVVGDQGVEEWTEDAALGGTGIQDDDGRGVIAQPDMLGPVS